MTTLYTVPTEAQSQRLNNHPSLSYGEAMILCCWQFAILRLDFDSGMARLERNIHQQKRFNETRLVKASREQAYKNAEYRMLKGN